MSRSTSYRPLSLSAEEQAELARQARVSRLADLLMPALARHAGECVRQAASAGLVSAADGRQLRQQLSSATDVQAVRDLMATIPCGSSPLEHRGAGPDQSLPTATTSLSSASTTTSLRDPARRSRPRATGASISSSGQLPAARSLPQSAERVPQGSSVLPQAKRNQRTTSDTSLATARWDLVAERARLDTLAADAAERDIDLDMHVAAASALLEAAQDYADAGALDLLRSQVRAASQHVDEVEEALDGAVVRTAARRVTMERLRSITEREMGFVSNVVDYGGRLSVEGAAADGRTLHLHLESHEGHDVLVTTATDHQDAVPEDHPAAGEVCDQSVATSAELHQIIDQSAAFDAGQVSVRQMPRRGQPDASDSTTPAVRKSRTATAPKTRRIR